MQEVEKFLQFKPIHTSKIRHATHSRIYPAVVPIKPECNHASSAGLKTQAVIAACLLTWFCFMGCICERNATRLAMLILWDQPFLFSGRTKMIIGLCTPMQLTGQGCVITFVSVRNTGRTCAVLAVDSMSTWRAMGSLDASQRHGSRCLASTDDVICVMRFPMQIRACVLGHTGAGRPIWGHS